MPSITNYLTDKHIQQIHKGKIFVMVENEDDIPFWKGIFEHFDIPTRIVAGVNTRKRIERGKTTVLKQKYNANKNYLLCVDSDYDHITQNDTDSIHSNPFIFQTYTYSYENYLCLPHTLETVCTEVTLLDEIDFDFIHFYEQYAEIVYKLFLYHLYDKINHNSQNLPIQNFHYIVDFPQHPKVGYNGKAILEKIEQEVKKKIEELNNKGVADENEIETLAERLVNLGLNTKNVYLFLRGHNLFDNTCRLIEQICKPNIDAEKKRLYQMGEGGKSKLNERFNTMRSVESILLLNKQYPKCEFFSKIADDISAYKNI